MDYERITVNDVRVGDRVARSRNHEFGEVFRIDEASVTRRLHMRRAEPFTAIYGERTVRYEKGSTMGNIRPARTAKLWRLKA